jgi:uncharacterized protein YegL
VLNLIRIDKYEALRKLSTLLPNQQRYLCAFELVERLNYSQVVERKVLIPVILILASIMASEKLSLKLQVISNIYVNLKKNKEILAISQATALFPPMGKEISQIVNVLDGLSTKSNTKKDSLQITFDLIISLNNVETGRSLTSILQLIRHIQQNDSKAAVNLVACKYFQQSPEQAVPIVSNLLKVFSQTNDPFEILKTISSTNELKTHLPSYLLSIYYLGKEIQHTKKSTDRTKIDLLKTTLNIVSSCLSNENSSKRLAVICDLIESIESNDSQRVLKQFQTTMQLYLPSDFHDFLQSISDLLHKKLARQSITYESILSIANTFADDKEKQILSRTGPIVKKFSTGSVLSIDEYLSISVELMSLFDIGSTQIDLFKTGKNIRSIVMKLTKMIREFPSSTMRNKQAEQLSFLVQTTLDLIKSTYPDDFDSIKAAFSTISGIAMFLKANNTITLVLEAIGLAINGTHKNLLNDSIPVVTRIEPNPSNVRLLPNKKEEIIKPSVVNITTTNRPVRTETKLNQPDEIHHVSVSYETMNDPVTPDSPFSTNNSLENRLVAEKEVNTLTEQIVLLSQKSEEQVSKIIQNEDLDLSQTITYLSSASQINKTIQSTINALQQMAANKMREEIEKLAKTALPQIFSVSLQLYKYLEWIDRSTSDISGHIKDKCHEIQIDITQVLDKLCESEELRRLWKSNKKNESMEDYDVPEDGEISEMKHSDRSQQAQERIVLDQIQQLMQSFEESKFSQGTLSENSTLHRFDIQLENLLSNYDKNVNINEDDDEDSEEMKNMSNLSRTTSSKTKDIPIVNRDMLLEIDDRGYVRSNVNGNLPSVETNQTLLNKNMRVRIVDDDEVKSGSPQAKNYRVMASKKDLDKLKAQAENTLNSLLKSVNKYDIGQITEACDPEQLPDIQLNRPRYALLARLTRNIQTMLLTRLRSALTRLYNEQQSDLQFEFIFCVDNSGSMSGKKIQEALNTLVILMETFHRLEWKFAVLRFGGEQKILKPLSHTSMHETVEIAADDQTSNLQQKYLTQGQFILESFTTDEKTLPATALRQVAENSKLFGEQKKPNVKRFIIMVTDGIFAQTDPKLFHKELERADAKLYIVCIIPPLPSKEKDVEQLTDLERQILEHEIKTKEFITSVAPGRNQLIQIGELNMLTKTVVADLINLIEESILTHLKPSISTIGTSPSTSFNKIHRLIPFTLSNFTNITSWKHADVHYTGRSYISDSRRKLERQTTHSQFNIDLSQASKEFYDHYDEIMNALEKSYSDLETHDEILVNTDKILQQLEQRFESYTNDLVRALEDNILPAYKPTQSLPDTRGNRLFMPGIVRFICTQGQYNRIYLNQIGSPKPEYRIALILDQSVSMTGPSYFAAVDIFLSFCAALNRIGIEDFNVLTYGRHIQLIKSYKQTYDRLFLHHFQNALKVDGELTLLSDAIFAASELLQQQSAVNNNNGPMMIFVFTDGYDTRGAFIHQIISYAEQRSINILGLGFGFESNGVSLAFNDWIIAQNPSLVADALIQWSNEQTDGQTPNDLLFHEENLTKILGENQQSYSSTDEIWKDERMQRYFDLITKNAHDAIELTFSSDAFDNPLIVEICFVMDCTGSMEPWIKAGKTHILAIAENIEKDMKEKFGKNSILRMAFVAYRDYTNAERFDVIDFHKAPNLQPVRNKIESQKAIANDDVCEDVQGGLEKALGLSWTPIPVRAGRFSIIFKKINNYFIF